MKTIEEKNRIIAEFMNVDQVDIDTYFETNGELKYHTSWEWLMPCCIKLGIDYICTDINEAYKTVINEIERRNLERH